MLEEIIAERKRKLAKLHEAGVDAYPIKTKRTHTTAAALADFGKLVRAKKTVFVAGRVMGLRDMGNVMFLDVVDESGRFQAVLKKENLSDFKLLKAALDRGDIVSVGGKLFVTKTKEKSIEAKLVTILAKSIRPLPDKWSGLEDVEVRLRQRYLEMLMDPSVRALFRKKTIFWQTFRDILKREGFLEVEMPVLEAVPGGAEAEPFITHHKALDTDFYLRISLELPLKKMLVAGYEKVFEIGRIFRNEGIDKDHLQDYTQVEFYWAYSDYEELMKFIEKAYKEIIKKTTGGLTTTYEGKKINWSKKWKKVDYVSAFEKANKMDPCAASRDELFAKAKALNLKPEPNMGKGRLIDLIFKKTVRSQLQEPCFLIDPPVEIEPLAKRKPKDPRRVERFQIVAAGTELGKGFSELNDPADQRGRFEEQMRLRQAGDVEAQQMDEDYVEALEYGMPPAAGFGISERLFAVLMDKPVRETVIFPLMRKK
ncbi:MAG TPA: lysine--tRNA ligase [Candidatus Paceibacterota bacterium]|nr:lysine--tRNA ligase [Candidatus Paceibacterota bacterium]